MSTGIVRILLVEDNPGDARLIRESLRDIQDMPSELTHVERLNEAIRCLKTKTFDVLLLDLSLPDSQGTDTVKRITAAWPDIPVVVLTGMDDEAMATEAVRCGAQDYLVKGQTGPRLLIRSIHYAIERTQAADALRQSEQRYRLLFDRNPDGVFSVDTTGRFIVANHACEMICGYSAAELLQKTFTELCAPDQLAETVAHFQRNVAQRAYSQVETSLIRKDGRRVDIWIAGEPIVSDGDVVAVHCTVKDITERRRVEAALKAATLSAEHAKSAAEQASKAKDHFLAVLSHELRNPLNPVLATASMLKADPRFDADTREQLEVIHRNAELEARLIDDLLDVTRIERGKVDLDRRPIELCTILRRAAEVCMPDIEARKLEFGIDLGPHAPYWIDADAARLQQVFWNLLKNSIKFTPPGGCVGIRCRLDGDGFVEAEVNDSGIGIESGDLSRLFNAFEQAERSITRQFGGLGLGLAISKALVGMHGGSVRASSPGKDKGATFVVRLPLLPAQAAFPASASTSEAPLVSVASRPLRILLVEDHGDTVRIMRRLLMANGHEVQPAADVATALRLAAEQPFNLLLSDLGLPDGSGLDLMRALRAKGINMPGIALSGFGQEQDVQRSREAGFAVHLVKPVSLPKLAEAIAKAMK